MRRPAASSAVRVLRRGWGSLRSGRAWCPPIPGFHLYLPSRAHLSTKMRAFIDFYAEKRALADGAG
ncbi:MAG: hypothetical protein LCH93_06850 [Proteobacteria bacterium]|nr:hypothetical protein [Pseudomonadota bacterium]